MSKKKLETRRLQRQARREERHRQEERLRAAKRRLIIWISTTVGAVVVIVAAIIAGSVLGNKYVQANNNTSSRTTLTSDNPAYPVVNDIACQTSEQLAYHIHAHLSIYIDGKPYALPATIGIASDQSCYYWLHTHKTDGVIHIESPDTNKYSLGTFFKMWEDHFSSLGYPSQLDSKDGWQVYVNGKPFSGDFRSIQLNTHELITMAYNSPGITPDTIYSWGTL